MRLCPRQGRKTQTPAHHICLPIIAHAVDRCISSVIVHEHRWNVRLYICVRRCSHRSRCTQWRWFGEGRRLITNLCTMHQTNETTVLLCLPALPTQCLPTISIDWNSFPWPLVDCCFRQSVECAATWVQPLEAIPSPLVHCYPYPTLAHRKNDTLQSTAVVESSNKSKRLFYYRLRSWDH